MQWGYCHAEATHMKSVNKRATRGHYLAFDQCRNINGNSYTKVYFAFFLFGLLLGGRGAYVSFILVPLKKTWGTLDSGIAVHSTDKQLFQMIQANQFFNKRVVHNSAHGT